MTAVTRGRTLVRAVWVGAWAGVIGGAAMVVGEKIEQVVTRRPDSYVPARALLTMVGRSPSDAAKPSKPNHVMHYVTAAALGALRGVWAVTGIRGTYANVWHTAVRLGFDQTVENATGVGAPPATWRTREQVVDVLHKTVFAVVTGVLADRFLPPVLESSRGRTSH